MKFTSKNSFSNSGFELINKNNTIYFRKFLKSANIRNLESILKQNKFKKLRLGNFNILSAKTLTSSKILMKKKYYDMIFYEGKSGDEILQRANIDEILLLRRWIKKNFFSKKIKNYYKVDSNIFRDKLNYIIKKIKNKKYLKTFKVKHIPDFIKLLNNEDVYYPTNNYCHGDLTLANIIINNSKKRLVLIDFLKTYNDNIVQDYAKLYQEFKLGWSARYQSSIEITRSLIVYKNIISDNNWKSLNNKLKKAIIIEIYMTIFRILPYIYANDKLTIMWIIQSIDNLRKLRKTNKF